MRELSILGYGFLGQSITAELSPGGRPLRVLSRRPPQNVSYGANVRFHVGEAENPAILKETIGAGLTIFALGSTFPTSVKGQLESYGQRELAILDQALTVVGDRKGHFVYISSAAVYGEVNCGAAEEDWLTSPVSAYGIHKLACEQLCLQRAETLGLKLTILRLSNPFGLFQVAERNQGLIGIVLNNLLLGRPTQIRGDGSAVRDYVPVGVLSAAITLLSENCAGTAPRIMNVSSGFGLKTLEVLEILARRLNRRIEVDHIPSVAGEIGRSVLSPKKLRAWGPSLPDASFSAGLAVMDPLLSRFAL